MSKERVCDDGVVTELELEEIKSEDEDLLIDNASYDLRTYGADFTVELLSGKFETGEIVVPDFQRRYVWPAKKATRLIESFLLGLPVPQIFLYREGEDQKLLVVDGQQRLRTINYFMNEKLETGQEFVLRGVKQKWEGKKYTTLSEPDRRRFNNYILRSTIFEQINPKDNTSIFEIFERLNTGGMALNEQEIRRCVIRGPINEFIEGLNNYPSWRKLLNKDDPDTRMKDLEMILRFLALNDGWKHYKKPMKDFISGFAGSNKNLNPKKQAEYRLLFESVVDKIYKEVGKDAFRLKAGINVAVLDSVMVGLASMKINKVMNLDSKVKSLKGKDEYLDAVSDHTTDLEKVEKRIQTAIDTFTE